MKKQSNLLQLLAPALLLFHLSCDKTSSITDGAFYIPKGGWEIYLPPGDTPDPTSCPGPKPANIGCSSICKPCIVHVCMNGEWTQYKLEWPKDMCSRPSSTTKAKICPRSPTGYCPPECQICI